MNLSEPNVLKAFLEAVKVISDDFVETSINELEQTSFEYKGDGGCLYETDMCLIPERIPVFCSDDDTILLYSSNRDPFDDLVAILCVEYTDDGEKYEDEDDRPFFIRRMLTGTYLLEPYEFDNTEKYKYDNRAAKVKNKINIIIREGEMI